MTLYYTVLYCTVLHCTVQYSFVLRSFAVVPSISPALSKQTIIPSMVHVLIRHCFYLESMQNPDGPPWSSKGPLLEVAAARGRAFQSFHVV